MTPWLVLGAVVAVVGVGRGAQVLANHVARYPTDVRRPGRLIRFSWTKPTTVRSPELRRLVAVISGTIVDEPRAKIELQETFAALDGPVSPLIDESDDRRAEQRRSQQIDDAITALERRHGL